MILVYLALFMLALTLVILTIISEIPDDRPKLGDPIMVEPVYVGRHWRDD